MTSSDKETLIRAYADGEVTWHSLQRCGFNDYLEVLANLGELGLRPPIATMTGPNVEARKRGIAIIQEQLRRNV